MSNDKAQMPNKAQSLNDKIFDIKILIFVIHLIFGF